MFAVSRFTVNKKAQMFHSYSEIWLFAPSVLCLVLLLTRKPRCLLVTALAPQLFRDLVVRSFCVSRFTVNKKAQMFARHSLVTRARGVRTRLYCTVLNWKLHEHTHPTTRRTPTRVHGVSYMGVETRDGTDTASCI